MSAAQGQARFRRQVAAYLGLAKTGSGESRSWWMRVTDVGEDSSALEAGIGFVLAVLLLVLVIAHVFQDPGWPRPLAAFAVVLLLGNLVRMAMLRRRSSRKNGRSRFDES